MRILLLFLMVFSGWAMAKELPVNSRLGGDFVLASTAADETRLSSFAGKVVLLNFGFTHCPDVCPAVLTRMVQVLKALGDKRSAVQPLFISFDPERDTLDRLREYLGYFGQDFIGMTGTPEQIASVTRLYGVVYLPQETGSAVGRLYAHSDFIYLLDQQGRVRALFSNKTSTAEMQEAIESLL